MNFAWPRVVGDPYWTQGRKNSAFDQGFDQVCLHDPDDCDHDMLSFHDGHVVIGCQVQRLARQVALSELTAASVR